MQRFIRLGSIATDISLNEPVLYIAATGIAQTSNAGTLHAWQTARSRPHLRASSRGTTKQVGLKISTTQQRAPLALLHASSC